MTNRPPPVAAPLLAALLFGCTPDAPDPAPTPTTYAIAKADLTAAAPRDICRTRDAAFLRNVLLKISAALPPGSSGFDFTDFSVAESGADGKRTATVRFRIALPDKPAQTLHAVASFDPETCATGEWAVDPGEGEEGI